MKVQDVRRLAFRVHAYVLFGVAIALTACGSKEPTPPPPTATLAVAVAPATLTLVAGTTGSANAAIVRGGGFAGAVTMTASGAPAGMTVSFGSATIAEGATTSTVSIATTGATVAGTYPITVSAAGTGVTTATTTISVTVTDAPPQSVSLSLSTAASSVQAGGADQTTTATITRVNGYAGALTLSQSGAPTGVTVTFNPNPVAAGGTSSAVTIAVGAATVPGSYPLTFTATGTGISAATAIYTLTVTAAPTPTATIALSTTSASVQAGGTNVTTTATVARQNGFAGALTLSQTGAPTGVTVSFSPNPIAAGSTTSTVTFAVAANTAAGTYPIVISAAGTGITSPAATYTLTVTAAPAQTATIALSSNSGTMQAGGTSITTTATVARQNGFAGALTLSQTGAPTGVTVSFSPNPIAAGGTTSTVTFAVASNTTAGTYPIVISAAGTGITSPTATFTLTVTAAPAPAATIALSSGAGTVQAGGTSATSTATITRLNGFTGALTLSQTGSPTGVTVSFSANPIATGSTQSTVTFAVASNAAAGVYPITITAAGSGITSVTATYTLTVTAAASGTTVTLNYCAEATPIWLAYQDGPTGTWTRVTPSGTTFSFTLTQTRGAIASVDSFDGGFDVNVTYASTTEFTSIGSAINLDACGSKTINGSVSNVSGTQFAYASLGYSTAVAQPAISSNFQLIDVRAGAQDLFASRVTTATRRADRIIIRRGLNIADGGTIPVLDFAAAESFAPAVANFSVTNVGSDTATVVSTFNGTRGSAFGFLASIQRYLAASGTVPLDVIPGANLNAGELQQVYALAQTANTPSSGRYAGVYFRTPADATLALGPALSAPTVTRTTSTPYVRPRVQLPLQAEYNRTITAEFEQTSLTRSLSITATNGYTGGTAWDFTMPDFSGVAGWQNTWAMQSGTAFDWTVSASAGAVFLFDPNVASGTTYRLATRASESPIP
jgi:hypothetical protein